MRKFSIREIRQHMSTLLKAVEAGEEIIIQRHGRPIAKISPIFQEPAKFPDRSELRSQIPMAKKSIADEIREMRDEEKY